MGPRDRCAIGYQMWRLLPTPPPPLVCTERPIDVRDGARGAVSGGSGAFR